MKIGTRDVGYGKPPFIIAEVGSNWRDQADCLTSIRMAAEAGADAVKFQHFTMDELYGYDLVEAAKEKMRAEGARGFLTVDMTGAPPALPASWLPELRAYADKHKIEFMCSAFSVAGYGRVDPYVTAHKVASCEAIAPPLLEAALVSGKPTFISLGAMTLDEIRLGAARWDPLQVIPLYCSAKYPANDVCPAQVLAMSQAFGDAFILGISDHSTSVFPFYGPVHEKHVNFVGAGGPDAPHSLSAGDFARMVNHIRGKVEPWSPAPEIMAIRRRFVPELGGWYRVKA